MLLLLLLLSLPLFSPLLLSEIVSLTLSLIQAEKAQPSVIGHRPLCRKIHSGFSQEWDRESQWLSVFSARSTHLNRTVEEMFLPPVCTRLLLWWTAHTTQEASGLLSCTHSPEEWREGQEGLISAPLQSHPSFLSGSEMQ